MLAVQVVLVLYLGSVTWKFAWRERGPADGGGVPDYTAAMSVADQEAIAALLEDARRGRNSTGAAHSSRQCSCVPERALQACRLTMATWLRCLGRLPCTGQNESKVTVQ